MKNLGFLFAIAMWTNTPARADQVQYLAHAPQALAAFMDMADGARKSVDIATFIFEPCHSSTQLMLEKLAEKARQGVRVRLIVDALQQKSAREKILSDYAARAGLRIKYYNRGEANLRLHIKMMVVDNERYISGGRNISDEYFGLSQENNYVDRDLRVEGASALQATAVFEELWASKTSAEGTGVARRFPGWQTACAKEAKPAVGIEAVREYLRREQAAQIASAPVHSCATSFTADAPDFAHMKYGGGNPQEVGSDNTYMNPARLNRKRATKEILSFIKGARQSLDMENWVYIPMWKLNQAIKEARDRGLSIRALTNEDIEDGPKVFREAMDYVIAKYAKRDSVKKMKIELISSKGALRAPHFELTPQDAPTHLHGKIILRDRRDAVVSSYNLDARSYNTNLESVVTVRDCSALVADIETPFAELRAINADDRASGRIPKKPAPSLAARLLAAISQAFL